MEAKVLHKSSTLSALATGRLLPAWVAAFGRHRRLKNNNCTLKKSITLGQ